MSAIGSTGETGDLQRKYCVASEMARKKKKKKKAEQDDTPKFQTVAEMEKYLNDNIKKFLDPDSKVKLEGTEYQKFQHNLQLYMQRMSSVTNALKTLHETMMSIIRNFR